MMLLCAGLSDRDDWLELNEREVKPGLAQTVGKAPPPVAGPNVGAAVGPAVGPALGPALGPDVGPGVVPDAVEEPRGPNIPALVKPLMKVTFFFFLNYISLEKTVQTDFDLSV